jgi:multidrug resistance protein, MATE family
MSITSSSQLVLRNVDGLNSSRSKLNIIRELARLGWPVFIAQLALMLYGVFDTILAGRYGTDDLAAVGIGSSIYITVFVAIIGVLFALTPVAAQLFGAGRHGEIGEQVRQTVWVGFLIIGIAMLLLYFPDPFFLITQSSEAVETKARAYLRAIAWALPALMLLRVFTAFSNAVSRPRPVMMLNLLGLAIKVPLSWVLLYGHFGLPEMGSTGCAVATLVASWVACIAAWGYGMRDSGYRVFAVYAHWSPPRWRAIRHLLALGLPIGVSFLVDVTAFTFMTLFVARLGTATSAAHQIAANFSALLFMLPMSLGNAAGVLVGQSIGARDFIRARRIGFVAMGLAGALGLVGCLLLLLFRSEVAAMYARDHAVQGIAVALLGIVAWYHFVDSVLSVSMHALRGYKRTVVPMVVSTVALWGVGLWGGYQLAFSGVSTGPLSSVAPLGASGFWIAAVISVAVAVIAIVWYYSAVSHQRNFDVPAESR